MPEQHGVVLQQTEPRFDEIAVAVGFSATLTVKHF